jgi:hypothetical protein
MEGWDCMDRRNRSFFRRQTQQPFGSLVTFHYTPPSNKATAVDAQIALATDHAAFRREAFDASKTLEQASSTIKETNVQYVLANSSEVVCIPNG